MTKLFTLSLLLLLCLTSCGSDTPTTNTNPEIVTTAPPAGKFDDVATVLSETEDYDRVHDLLMDNYSRVSDPASGRVDRAAGKQYIALAEELADKAGSDTLAAMPLYQAAEVYQALGNYRGAASVFNRIHRDYPSFSRSAESLFMLAFTYDENLKDYPAAKSIYEEFITKYPDHTFADDAAMLIGNLGKTDAELIQQLQQ